jgi:hypothetical protein
MEEAPKNSKESSHSAHGNGIRIGSLLPSHKYFIIFVEA